jgi:UPF0176 protein
LRLETNNFPDFVIAIKHTMVLHNRINGKELKAKMRESDEERTTLSFYKYMGIEKPNQYRDLLYKTFEALGIKGRIYVAQEGINAQISLPSTQLDAFKSLLSEINLPEDLRLNQAIEDDGKSFFKLKITVRKKIVADGLDDATFNPAATGTHLDAAAFNELYNNPDVVLVDMRNHYESEVGRFEKAITPDVETFREALPWVEKEIESKRDKPVVMYCTGGIRCEKASAWFKHQGFEQVFQLNGGIIEYARQCKENGIENHFKGVNFVFDERMGERISEEVLSNCHLCGTKADQHINCANDACHLLFIQCPDCAKAMNNCCSDVCIDFLALPLDEQKEKRKTIQFNGSKLGAHGRPGMLLQRTQKETKF